MTTEQSLAALLGIAVLIAAPVVLLVYARWRAGKDWNR